MAQAAKPTNGCDQKELQSYIQRIENKKEEIASAMGAAMRECKTHREDIRDIYTEAKEKGLPIKALKAEVALREKDREKAKIIAGLKGDDADALELIMEALGDFASDGVSEAFLNEAAASLNLPPERVPGRAAAFRRVARL